MSPRQSASTIRGQVLAALPLPVLAHAGGVDEIGLFLIPALLAVLVLRGMEKRARRGDGDDDR